MNESASTRPVRAALDGMVVVELGGGIAGAYAGRLLADLGAWVVQCVDPTVTGDGGRTADTEPGSTAIHATTLFLGRGKTCVGASTHDAEAALGAADIVIRDWGSSAPPDLQRGIETCAGRPELIWVDLAPFGLSGPRAGDVAEPLTVHAASGALFSEPSGRLNRDFYGLRPPVCWGANSSAFVVGLQGACAALAGVLARLVTGRGQHVEVSMQEALMHVVRHDLDRFFREGHVRRRAGAPEGAYRELVSGTMRCLDGFVALWPLEPYMIENLAALMGHPAWSRETWFGDPFARDRHAPEMRRDIEAWVRGHTMEELRELGQQHRIAVSPVYDPSQVLTSPQLRARGFFRAVRDGAVHYETPGLPFATDRTVLGSTVAPSGDRTPGVGPLAGIRLVELSHWQAGPAAGMVLAQMGAEVIKIESSSRLDQYRREGEAFDETFLFSEFNQAKGSVRLNLKHPQGAALARRLVLEHSDGFLSNMREDALQRAGLDYESLASERSDLVHLLISNAGTRGPESDQLGYATTFAAGGGLSHLTGYADGAPAELIAWPDTVIGVWGAFAMLAGLVRARRTGAGTCLDLSGREAVASLIGDVLVEASRFGTVRTRCGNASTSAAPHGCYRCSGDDQWVAMAIIDDEQWQRAAAVLPGWAQDPALRTTAGRLARRTELDDLVTEWTRRLTPDDVVARLQAVRVPASRVFSGADLADDPHIRHRRSFVTYEHPLAGELTTVRAPWSFSGTPAPDARPAPWLGEHDAHVLSEILGLDGDAVAHLMNTGVNA